MKENHCRQLLIKVNESETDGGSVQTNKVLHDLRYFSCRPKSDTDSYWENLPTHDLN